ncbi:GAF domain-containing protein [Desulfovibrio inopinatus]|uniref:GAF domain-containing protein n=1 Tax=Desulfovibrio inopinatus TaxID=102109 RepID=UPI0004174095|nr:GAF domain-containing protein [Desulfovibrio inopinatus]
MLLHESFHTILAIVCNVFDAYSGVLFLPLPGTRQFTLASSFSLGDDIRPELRLNPGQGLVGWILREGQPLCISNFDKNRGKLGYYSGNAETKIKAFMGVPLGKTPGAVCIDSKKTYSFVEKDQKILSQFAGLFSSLYLNIGSVEAGHLEYGYYHSLELISSLHKKTPKWSTFQSQFLKIVAEATRFQYSFLAVVDDRSGQYFLEGVNDPSFFDTPIPRAYPLGGGAVGWACRNGSSIGSEDFESSSTPLFGKNDAGPTFASFLCYPVVFSKKTRAVLVLADQNPVTIYEETKTFIQMVSEYLALFLENLHLKTKLEKPL